jgi:hypothetical protein
MHGCDTDWQLAVCVQGLLPRCVAHAEHASSHEARVDPVHAAASVCLLDGAIAIGLLTLS